MKFFSIKANQNLIYPTTENRNSTIVLKTTSTHKLKNFSVEVVTPTKLYIFTEKLEKYLDKNLIQVKPYSNIRVLLENVVTHKIFQTRQWT